MAAGFSIDISNIEKFKQFIFRKFKNINEDISKLRPLIIDSKISPTAINLEFYNKINTLSPFGSGNPEPKFIIENLKSVNSKVVGEKHIKSILKANDGSVLKTFTANAKDGPLEPFLNDKYKKKINIAGKMKLNEWSGKRTIEFIIEDISLSNINTSSF